MHFVIAADNYFVPEFEGVQVLKKGVDMRGFAVVGKVPRMNEDVSLQGIIKILEVSVRVRHHNYFVCLGFDLVFPDWKHFNNFFYSLTYRSTIY